MAETKTIAKRVQSQERRQQVYDLMMRGYTRSKIARELGVARRTVDDDITLIREEWIGRDGTTVEDLQKKTELRIERLNHIMQTAYSAFDRSCEAGEESVVTMNQCERCVGYGRVTIGIDADAEIARCPVCEGTGEIQTQRILRKKKQSGDPSFLRIAKDCELEIARLQGLHQSAEIVLNSITINNTKNELTLQAQSVDKDKLIAAKAAYDGLLEDAKKKRAETLDAN